MLFSSLNVIIRGRVNQGLVFIQLNLQPADISHDCGVTGSQLNSVRRSSVASCIPALLDSPITVLTLTLSGAK